jgi:DNA polymerase V
MGGAHVPEMCMMQKRAVVFLADLDNFYAECQRVFDPGLQGRPIVVLSNNDGCVVARSREIKKLIKMGQPFFECRNIIQKYNVAVFSSNYSLYADMSARVFALIAEFAPCLEKYSIDECFAILPDYVHDDYTAWGYQFREAVRLFTGLSLSVGIAPTKGLTKIATEIVKKHPHYGGVLDLTVLSEADVDALLDQVAVEDVWGIGPRYSLFLRSHGFLTARDLKYTEDRWIRNCLSVVVQRIVLELRGIPCIPLIPLAPAKKSIVSAKTFGKELTELAELEVAAATYTALVAQKLREQGSLAASLTVFVHTNHFHPQEPQYAKSATIRIPFPTAYTPELIHYALEGLRSIYRKGFKYRKVGIYLSRISPEEVFQPDLFGEASIELHYKRARLMSIVDALNKLYGPDTLHFAIQGVDDRSWKMRRSFLSGRFTTQWNEIPLITM